MRCEQINAINTLLVLSEGQRLQNHFRDARSRKVLDSSKGFKHRHAEVVEENPGGLASNMYEGQR